MACLVHWLPTRGLGHDTPCQGLLINAFLLKMQFEAWGSEAEQRDTFF